MELVVKESELKSAVDYEMDKYQQQRDEKLIFTYVYTNQKDIRLVRLRIQLQIPWIVAMICYNI